MTAERRIVCNQTKYFGRYKTNLYLILNKLLNVDCEKMKAKTFNACYKMHGVDVIYCVYQKSL